MLQVCVIKVEERVPFHTQTKLKLSVILEAAVREQEDSDMEMKINLDMNSLLCLLLSFCFLWALLLLSHHIYSVFVFCFFQHFLVTLQQKQRLFCFFNAPLLYAASAAWRQEIRFFFKWWIKCLLPLFYAFILHVRVFPTISSIQFSVFCRHRLNKKRLPLKFG